MVNTSGASGTSGQVTVAVGGTAFNIFDDEKAVRAEQKRAREELRQAQLAQQLQAMRSDSTKVTEMTHQEELRRLQQHLWRSGDEAAVQKIADRLRPSVR